jgi:hypothetical protein
MGLRNTPSVPNQHTFSSVKALVLHSFVTRKQLPSSENCEFHHQSYPVARLEILFPNRNFFPEHLNNFSYLQQHQHESQLQFPSNKE